MAFTKDSRSFRLERTAPNARPSALAWDLATGKPAEVPGVTHLGDSLDQVSPDGSRLLKIVEGAIEIDDRQSGRTLLGYGDEGAYLWAIFSPDGNYILACKDKSAELFDASPVPTPVEKR